MTIKLRSVSRATRRKPILSGATNKSNPRLIFFTFSEQPLVFSMRNFVSLFDITVRNNRTETEKVFGSGKVSTNLIA